MSACLMLAAGLLATASVTDPNGNRIRIALAEEMVGEVNESDAKVAMKGWASAVAHETGIEIDYDANVISTGEQIVQKIRARSLDAFAFATNQYFQVASLVDSTILVDEPYAQGGEEYLVLVHEESGIRDLAGLRGHAIMVLKHPKMSLANVWLETLLASSNLGTSDSFFSRKSNQTKLSKTVLPVFFKQADACLVTRRGFATISELNPQLGKKLLIVAKSTKLVPILMGFHKDYAPERRKKFVSAMANLYERPSGRQALLLFEGSRLVATDVSALKSAMDLLNSYEHLKGKSLRK